MSDNILEAQDLHYCYSDGTQALKGLNLGIRRGQTTAILGGNGAGKSTFFLNCNGILKPSSGKMLYNGKSIDYSRSSLKDLRRAIQMRRKKMVVMR